MQGNAGIWIDHKEAFIVFAGATDAEAKDLSVDKHVKFSGHGSGHEGSNEDKQERQLENQRGKYYDEVITHVIDAESILLFGPGEAKGELEKRLGAKGLGKRIVGVETVDRMTDHQIVAKVRQHYQK
ncbi:MAG: hypothetical protein M3R58_15785 [Pseudomonadota bacterium]|nr:hypothetical protein [Pseudomonadota bacterium]